MGYSSWNLSRFFSTIHALVVSYLCIIILLTRENLHQFYDIQDDLWSSLFQFSTTYLAADCFMMLLFPTEGDWQYLLHHLIGGGGIYGIWKTGHVWFIGLMFMFTEISTIWLNLSWFLLKQKERSPHALTHVAFVLAGVMLLLTFFIGRILGGAAIWYYLYDVRYEISMIPVWQAIYIYLGSATITSLNCYWFVKLIAKLSGQFTA
jgi:hypothetical protein